MSSATMQQPELDDHRSRLLEAMASLVACRGYGDIAVADVVREAGVSKRTFYEHFTNKEQCCLSLFQAAADSALRTLRRSVNPELPWQDQLEFALFNYLGHLADGHELLRALFVDIHYMGVEGLMLRRSIIDSLADYMLEVIGSAPGKQGVFERHHAVAAVGAIHEWVLLHIEQGRGAHLRELAPQSVQLLLLMAGEARAAG